MRTSLQIASRLPQHVRLLTRLSFLKISLSTNIRDVGFVLTRSNSRSTRLRFLRLQHWKSWAEVGMNRTRQRMERRRLSTPNPGSLWGVAAAVVAGVAAAMASPPFVPFQPMSPAARGGAVGGAVS